MEKFLFKIAKKWIAGDTVDDALLSAKNAYQSGRHAIINKLGEYHTSKKQIQNTIEEYQKIVRSFRRWKIRGAISVKPTQIGLSISQKECYRNLENITFTEQGLVFIAISLTNALDFQPSTHFSKSDIITKLFQQVDEIKPAES